MLPWDSSRPIRESHYDSPDSSVYGKWDTVAIEWVIFDLSPLTEWSLISCSDDKNGDDATSASQVADMYRNQDQIKNQTGGVKEEEDDDIEYWLIPWLPQVVHWLTLYCDYLSVIIYTLLFQYSLCIHFSVISMLFHANLSIVSFTVSSLTHFSIRISIYRTSNTISHDYCGMPSIDKSLVLVYAFLLNKLLLAAEIVFV